MTMTATEEFGSRRMSSGKNPSASIAFICMGEGSGVDAEAAAFDELTSIGFAESAGLTLSGYPNTDQIAEGVWHVEIQFGSCEPKQPKKNGDPPQFSFSTCGATGHTLISLAEVGIYPSGKQSMNGLIGVQKIGEAPEGCDKIIPAFPCQTSKIIPATALTAAYVNTLYTLTGTVNNASYSLVLPSGEDMTFSAGELLFKGANCNPRGENDYEITFFFEGCANKTSMTVANITGIAKKGFEYLWIRREIQPANSSDANSPTLSLPDAVYVNQIYEYTNFASLAI